MTLPLRRISTENVVLSPCPDPPREESRLSALHIGFLPCKEENHREENQAESEKERGYRPSPSIASIITSTSITSIISILALPVWVKVWGALARPPPPVALATDLHKAVCGIPPQISLCAPGGMVVRYRCRPPVVAGACVRLATGPLGAGCHQPR